MVEAETGTAGAIEEQLMVHLLQQVRFLTINSHVEDSANV
jgi:hypothetical protein